MTWTDRLLLLIAVLLFAHLALALIDRPLGAETFRLDSCVTDDPRTKPAGYVHVVVHSVAETEPPDALSR